MPVESTPSHHPFFRRNAAGEIVIRWWRLVIFVGAPLLVVNLLVAQFSGRALRPTQILIPFVIVLLPQLLIVQFAKRRLEGKRLWQFSMSALLVGMTAACVVFAMLGMDRRVDLERFARRDDFTATINEIIARARRTSSTKR